MSSGAILQLEAYGEQDKYITGNPQITHFKSVIKRHTHFAIESIENNFDGNYCPGERVRCKLQRSGDLIHQIYLKIQLPKLQEEQGKDDVYISWVNAIGYHIIHFIEIRIGDRVIDRQYGEWMNIWSELTTTESKKEHLYSMIGKFDNFDETKQNGPLNLYIPLSFWFCKDIGSSLPIVALQNQDVTIDIVFKDIESLWVSNNKEKAEQIIVQQSLGLQDYEIDICKRKPKIEFDSICLLVDYIFLDTNERTFFAKNTHYYLIEQIQETSYSIDTTTNFNTFELSFNHPVKELVWVIRGKQVGYCNQWDNYSDTVLPNIDGFVPEPEIDNCDKCATPLEITIQSILSNIPSSPIKNAIIRFEGVERFERRDEKYFRVVQPWKYHSASSKKNIYIYSFCDEPEKLQPTGTANFSRLDRATLQIETKSNLQESFIYIYAMNYNVLECKNGLGHLLFIN